jgi:outer membrane receptor protein involved in Fe transport
MTQDENTILDGYTIADASVALMDQGGRWDATVYVKNITDEFYPLGIASQHQSILANGYVQTFDKTANRTVGLEMRYRW